MDLEIKRFDNIDLSDRFFDSLRESYPEFDQWFTRKATAGESAYVFYNDNGNLSDFLYLKIEEEEVTDTVPNLPIKKRLKVGTFKLMARGTRRGERFMKKIMDRAVADDVDEVYVTIFPKDDLMYLINFFEKFGFVHVADKPHDGTISEYVLVKNMRQLVGDIEKDYPFVKVNGSNKRLLSIHPSYHTKLFPDSKLNTEEPYDLVQDITPTNGIYKIYICWMRDAATLKKGDNVVIYRMGDGQGPAYFRAVATSICTIMEVKRYMDFIDINDYLKYTSYSVFSETERRNWYRFKSNFIVIKMLYNVAFANRIIRKDLLEKVGIPGDIYWGICELNDEQYSRIIKLGGANERYFVN